MLDNCLSLLLSLSPSLYVRLPVPLSRSICPLSRYVRRSASPRGLNLFRLTALNYTCQPRFVLASFKLGSAGRSTFRICGLKLHLTALMCTLESNFKTMKRSSA